jgi:hypothetical protein
MVPSEPRPTDVSAGGSAEVMESLLRARAFRDLLRLTESILRIEPGAKVALQYRERAELRLRAEYRARFGSFSRTPQLVSPSPGVEADDLDASSRYLLSLVDGRTTIDELLRLSPSPELETLATLGALSERGTIKI